ncbi:XdhC family protein [Cochlodiniinecator piscidefendens]|uniref:XdhC family protein n=1 Tax=Cochlodiniinecator piscidefendens TaxID=2715756 RepID=UPI0014080570|nr:XdhC family protein [Cochlodiniinecator piscidefendens]
MNKHIAPEDSLDAIRFLNETDEQGVLAVIIGVSGPSYRPVGAMMAVTASGHSLGTLSSGCVEKDIILNAKSALHTGKPKVVRYGLGSEIMDIILPCGGGLEILLLPTPSKTLMHSIVEETGHRRPVLLQVHPEAGIAVSTSEDDSFAPATCRILMLPKLRFILFGKGSEITTFANLVNSLGYEQCICSPDEHELSQLKHTLSSTIHLNAPRWPTDVHTDPWTAILLFFHDHEREPPILLHALLKPCHFIGAQGSRKTAATRRDRLRTIDPNINLEQLAGPIGLIPSTRDAKTLAVSVLAEVLAKERITGFEA